MSKLSNSCVLSININFKPSVNLRESFSQKLGLELWQLFTVLAIVFSFASSFMWLSLVNPRVVTSQINQVDRAKALVYNQYQQDLVELKSVKINQQVFEHESCDIKTQTDNADGYNKVQSTITSSKSKINNEMAKTNTNLVIFQDETNVIKTYKSYLSLLDKISIEESKQKDFGIQKSLLVDKLSLICKDSAKSLIRGEVVSSLGKIEVFAPNTFILEKLAKLKTKILDTDFNMSTNTDSLLVEVNSMQFLSSDILDFLKQNEKEFTHNIKKIELWERRIKAQNPNIITKTIYIYDA